ncbi:MAG: 1-acyl-sn-glycerol-3-phosphate acyltransferase [Deltaproteobacteria bacterium]
MTLLRKPLKIAAFLVLVITFLPVLFLVDLFIFKKRTKLYLFSRISSFYLRVALAVLGVRVRVKNASRLKDRKKNYFIISNHLSYIDIFAIYSVSPSLFVANSELEESFLLGSIVRYSGGVFVERRSRAKLLTDITNITNILNMGINVVIFPEGTTSNGERVMPFKTSFLGAAAETGADVLPICIRYREINGRSVDKENGHLVYFYENITFFEHFFRLLNLRSITVELRELEVIESRSGVTRKELTEQAFSRISDAYNEKCEDG